MVLKQRRKQEDELKSEPKKQKISTKTQKLLDEYYENQNRLLKFYEEDVVTVDSKDVKKEEGEREEDIHLAQACMMLNIASLVGNLVASVISGSLSIMSTFVDSSMDIACSLVMNLCLSLISKSDAQKYPRGRERLELIGVVLCSVIMAFANISMIVQSINSIVNDTVDPEMTTPTYLIVIVQTLLKGILSWLCYRRGSTSSMIIAMDLRNDLMTRTLALICGYLGDAVWKQADPLGAIAVCSWIAFSWFRHAVSNIPQLTGIAAKKEQISRIVNIVLAHDTKIKYVDHVMVYYTGSQSQVELHIVMDEELPLKITHDVSHSLEKKLMKLDFVERCFVHVDYFCDGD